MKKRHIGRAAKVGCAGTVRVEVERVYLHPVYGKIVRGRTVCYADDPQKSVAVGDSVEIVESRPLSKTKRWVVCCRK